jgi:hypothetical protein
MTKKKNTPNAEFRDWDFVPADEFLPPQKAPTHIMAERENILTVAQLHLPEGMTRHEYALQLMKLNTSFAVGRIINLV